MVIIYNVCNAMISRFWLRILNEIRSERRERKGWKHGVGGEE